ncbi:MAG: ABC transporter permease [Agathobacter sp.]|uniref:ABC transporter permease n=1 Tax=Agathobacter sp. TaxID=2021311 RepID=UPI002585E7D6|nr:ABC transporter permease [Agathobacter sp.]MCR5677681.1 ABC transporter permease [Agathobacter sp.]
MLKEALSQIWNHRKTYLLLSITVLLTFTAIGVYMILDDSIIFNKYKHIMHESHYISTVGFDRSDEAKERLLKNKIEQMSDTHYYCTEQIQGISLYDHQFENAKISLEVQVIPNHIWAYYWSLGERAEMLDGEKSFSVGENEIIICKTLSDIMDQVGEKDYLDVAGKRLKVTGVMKDWSDTSAVMHDDGIDYCYVNAFVSEKTFRDLEKNNRTMIIYSPHQQEIEAYTRDLGLRYSSVYEEKEEMKKEIIRAIDSKMVITIMLILILGINMVGCYMNSLAKRKYEIAVKRALGASKMQIIKQFLLESLIVFLSDILLAFAISMAILGGVKIFYVWVMHDTWVIHITGYSLLIYAISASFMAVYLSCLFSILSTKVEVIQYIKAE